MKPKMRVELPDGSGGRKYYNDTRIESVNGTETVAGVVSEMEVVMANKDGALNHLQANDEIRIEGSEDGGNTWEHVLLGIIEGPKKIVSTDGLKVRLNVSSYMELLEDRPVSEVFTDTTVEELVVELMSREVPELTTNNVVGPGIELSKIIFTNKTVKEAMEKLTEIIEEEYIYYIDQNKDFHFEPDGTTYSGEVLEYGVNIAEAEIGPDEENLVNFAVVYGQNQKTRKVREVTFDGTEQTFETEFKPGAVQITNQTTNTTLSGGVRGINSLSSSGIDYIVDFQRKEITVEAQGDGDEGEISYNRGHPVFASARDVESIGEYNLQKKQVMGEAIEDQDLAQKLARKLVSKFSEPLLRGEVEIEGIMSLKAGKTADILIESQDIDDRLTIKEVEYEYNGEKFVQTVTLNEVLGSIEETIRNHETRIKELEGQVSGSLELVPQFVFPSDTLAIEETGSVKVAPIGESFILGRSLLGSAHLFETATDTETDKGFDRGTLSGDAVIDGDSLSLSSGNTEGWWNITVQKSDSAWEENNWRNLVFDTVLEADTDVEVNVFDSGGNLLASDITSGTDLSTIEGTEDENLEIEVHLISTTSGNTPSVERVKANYKPFLLGDQSGDIVEVATW